MPTLTIAASELRRLAGIDASDTSQDTILEAVATAEQDALEFAIDPTTLADSDYSAVLTLGVAEQLAGSYLCQMARAPLPLGALTLGAIKLTPPTSAELRALGNDLAAKGAARLAAYKRLPSVAGNLTLAETVPPTAFCAAGGGWVGSDGWEGEE